MRRWIFLILLIIGTIILFLPLQKVFSFTEIHVENPIMHYLAVADTPDFTIRYTHSIHKTDVLEHYKIVEENRLKLELMVYENLAIGMPGYAEEGQTLTLENGKYYLRFDEPKIINDFAIHIGDIDMDLALQYNNNEYNLKSNLQRGHAYLFQVQRVSLWQIWKGVKML